MTTERTAPVATPPSAGGVTPDQTASRGTRHDLGDLALGLGLAGLLPVPGVVASVAAVVCGRLALTSALPPADPRPARAGVALGLLGIAAPLLFLFVYCVVLGYPFPIRRYR